MRTEEVNGAPASGMVPRESRSRGSSASRGLLLLLLAQLLHCGPAYAAQEWEATLTAAGGRVVPVTVYAPDGGCDPCDLAVFSHGANAAPERYRRLLHPWADAGYLVVAPLHVDSELNPDRDQYGPEETRATRLEDFALLAGAALQPYLAELGLESSGRVVATGHSYGALIAQLAAGATLGPERDALPVFAPIRAALDGVVALSPPGPFGDVVAAQNWASISEPMLVVTGTTDVLPPFINEWQAHLASFESAAGAPAYALIYEGQDHYFNGAFGRPKEDIDDATVSALASLNDEVIAFMNGVRDGALPAPETWAAREDPRFEARVSPATLSLREERGKQ